MPTDLQVERWWPFVGAVIVTAGWWYALGAPFPTDFTALMGASATAAAVLMGFLGTAKAIVLGLTGSEAFQILKRAGYHDDLLSYLRWAIYGSAILLVVSLAGFFVEPTQNSGVALWAVEGLSFIWILCVSHSIFSFLRVTNILFKVVSKV